MSTENERVEILEMLDRQQITFEQAVELLEAISGEDEALGMSEAKPPVESQPLEIRNNGYKGLVSEPEDGSGGAPASVRQGGAHAARAACAPHATCRPRQSE